VQVEDDRVGIQLLGELYRFQPVRCRAHDGQFGLPVDQLTKRIAKVAIIVRDQDADPPVGGFPERFRHQLKASLAPVGMQPNAGVAIIGAALDLGAGRRGVDMGPSAIRYAGLYARIESLGRRVEDWGNVTTAVAEASSVGDERTRFLPQIKETCERVADLVVRAVEQELLPLVLGGDHSVALGTLGGLARASGPGGVLWLDAHGDLNRPGTSPTGNVHGMPLAAALGLAGPDFDSPAFRLPAVESSRLALVGVRSLDAAERELLAELDAQVYTMSDIDRLSVERVMREALEHVAGDGFVHVSLDLDVLDPEVAPGVGTPVRGGLSYREAHLALELVAESGLASSFEVVEVNPILDRENETAKLAVDLVASALGARIL
jgi:arginase